MNDVPPLRRLNAPAPQHLRACELCIFSSHNIEGLHCVRCNLDCDTARTWTSQCGPQARFLDIPTWRPAPPADAVAPSVAGFASHPERAAGPVTIKDRP